MKLKHFLRANGFLFAALLLTALAHAGAAIALAWSVRRMFDGLPAGGTPPVGIGLHPVLPTLLAVAALFGTTVLQRRLTDGIGLGYVHTVRQRLFQHLLRAAPIGTATPRRSNLLLPFVGDLTAVRQWVGDGITRLALGSVIIVLLLGYMAMSHAMLAAIVAAALVALALCAAVLHGPLDNATRALRRRRGILSSFVAGRLEAAATSESMGRSRSEAKKVARRSYDVFQASVRRAWLVGALRGLTQSSGPLMLVLVLLIAAGNLGGGTMSSGEVLGMMSLVGVMGQALQDMGRALELFVPGRVAMQRLHRILSLPPRVRDRRLLAKEGERGLLINNLLVRGLSLSAHPTPITMTASPGDVILLEGPSGCGKSAFMAVLGRVSAPQKGSIKIDGADLASLSRVERQRLIGMAGQAVPLLPGTVGMNLKYRHPHATPTDVDVLIKRLCLAEQGLGPDRVLIDPRNTLSSGQYQSLLVGRAVLGLPALLLLDGIDSSLPPTARGELAAIVGSYPGVVIMIAQSSQLRAAATRLWRVENGVVQDVTVGSGEIKILSTSGSRRNGLSGNS